MSCLPGIVSPFSCNTEREKKGLFLCTSSISETLTMAHVKQKATSWFFLSECSQRVRAGQYTAMVLNLSIGTPQGDVLRPLHHAQYT